MHCTIKAHIKGTSVKTAHHFVRSWLSCRTTANCTRTTRRCNNSNTNCTATTFLFGENQAISTETRRGIWPAGPTIPPVESEGIPKEDPKSACQTGKCGHPKAWQWVRCDNCQLWFHSLCAGVRPKKAECTLALSVIWHHRFSQETLTDTFFCISSMHITPVIQVSSFSQSNLCLNIDDPTLSGSTQRCSFVIKWIPLKRRLWSGLECILLSTQ